MFSTQSLPGLTVNFPGLRGSPVASASVPTSLLLSPKTVIPRTGMRGSPAPLTTTPPHEAVSSATPKTAATGMDFLIAVPSMACNTHPLRAWRAQEVSDHFMHPCRLRAAALRAPTAMHQPLAEPEPRSAAGRANPLDIDPGIVAQRVMLGAERQLRRQAIEARRIQRHRCRRRWSIAPVQRAIAVDVGQRQHRRM